MAKQKKKRRPRRHGHELEVELAHERLSALDDAVHAAVGSLARHLGAETAVPAVADALLRSAANALWHASATTEDEFAAAARQAFQDIAEAHADCARSQAPEAALRREGLH